jgi:hypothetical protein
MTENGSESLPFEPPEQENIRLREENARLRRLLSVHSIAIPQLVSENPPPARDAETAPPVNKEERARKRIALFRDLFRGREDVYARRWENEDGRHGYMPAAVKDWGAINRSRPEERKKVDQKTRRFLQLTDAAIENHLMGKETVGVYPLLSDETCWFLAADFDKKTWEYDSQAFLETCLELSVPAALERSRSGKGGHIGSSLIVRCQRSPRANSDACCLREPWSAGISSVSIPMIAFSQTKTRCPKEDSGT